MNKLAFRAGRLAAGAFLAMLAAVPGAYANDVAVEFVELAFSSGDWHASVTLRHADTGWKHYADAWRVVDKDGNVFGTRTLWHPHVDEQPFTRSLSNIRIPADIGIVYVEAHDKVHGWSPQRVRVDLSKTSGDRYRVRRR